MSDGKLFTVPAAKMLSENLDLNKFDIYYDHGGKESSDKVGKIVSWFGTEYKAPFRPLQLGHLDIAITLKNSGQTIALIEIEDTTDRVKIILGDVLGILMGSGIVFGTSQQLDIGAWTRLIVLVNACSREHQRRYKDRIEFLQKKLIQVKNSLSTPNSSVERVIIDTFVEQDELNDKIMDYVGKE